MGEKVERNYISARNIRSRHEINPIRRTIIHNYSSGLLASVVDESGFPDARVYHAHHNISQST